MRVAHFGGFDASNFGDQLFPLLFEQRLAPGVDAVHVTPTGRRSIWRDAVPTVDYSTFRRSPGKVSAIVIGGGNIVYTGATTLSEYDDGQLLPALAFPTMWLGAADASVELGVPLVWHVPGVRSKFSAIGSHLASFVADVSDLIGVRDSASLEFMRKAGVTKPISCVIDTAIEAASLWAPEEIEGAYASLFAQRGRSIPARTLAIHLSSRYVSEPLNALAERLDRVSRSLEATPVLLALGPCHGDTLLQSRVARCMATAPLEVGAGTRLIDLAACIAKAHAYVGSSLHGLVVACSFQTPALPVAVESKNRYRKFSGFLEHLGVPRRLCSSWSEAEWRLAEVVDEGPYDFLGIARRRLDEHWNHMRQIFAKGVPRWKRRDRAERLRCLVGGREGDAVHAARLDQLCANASRSSCMAKRILLCKESLPSVDVVICVHNALDHVRACFDSLSRTSHIPCQVVIVNDGSEERTTQYLRRVASDHHDWSLIENKTARRYTLAANQALKRTTADYVVLLNSDVVLPKDWLRRLASCAYGSARIGLVGPLSNAAGWQSIPEVHSKGGDWMVNELPSGIGVELMGHLVSVLSEGEAPQVPMLNGFCMLVKRAVFDTIGYFDPGISPNGYAEEVDFCFRAADAGFSIVIDDSAYVYHSKSSSYGHAARKDLARIGRQRVISRHGRERFENARLSLRNNVCLADLRRRVGSILESFQASTVAPSHM